VDISLDPSFDADCTATIVVVLWNRWGISAQQAPSRCYVSLVGETRTLYAATAGWSPAQERTLMLIIKRAILTPRSL
jgi:hypothetical protein